MPVFVDSFSSLLPPTQESTCGSCVQRFPYQKAFYQVGKVVIGHGTFYNFVKYQWRSPGEILLGSLGSLLYGLAGINQEVGIAHAVDNSSGCSRPWHQKSPLN